MHAADAEASFAAYAERQGASPTTVARALDLLLGWYESERAEDAADLLSDGDMLLFEWGTYDWGGGPSFEVRVTRQLISAGSPDPEMWQLSVALRYDPTEFDKIEPDEQWCTHPGEACEFRAQVAASAAYTAAATRPARHVEISFTRV